MILLPNPKKPRTFGDASAMLGAPRHYVAYEFPSSYSFPSPSMGSLSNLSSNVYAENCQWSASSINMSGVYSGGANCVIFGNCSANTLTGHFGGTDVKNACFLSDFWRNRMKAGATDRLVLSDGASGVSVSRMLAPGEASLDATDQNIAVLTFEGAPQSGQWSFTLTGSGPISMNSFCVGVLRSWLPASSYSYELQLFGEGKVTDIGVVYGYKMPSRRMLSCSWDALSDTDRRAVERYLDAVQNVTPHYVIASPEMEYIPPMFAYIKNQTLPNVKAKRSWTWGATQLNFMEAT
jgi:hypothetical protein